MIRIAIIGLLVGLSWPANETKYAAVREVVSWFTF